MHDLNPPRTAPRSPLGWWLLALAAGALECLALARCSLLERRRSP